MRCRATALKPVRVCAGCCCQRRQCRFDLTGIDWQANMGALLAQAMRLAGVSGGRKHHPHPARIAGFRGPTARPSATPVTTEPYPGFATDLQAPFMGLMCRANGVSAEFARRFLKTASCMCRNWRVLGADISLARRHGASSPGSTSLYGAPVMATDLRASVTLIIAGLMAEGQTEIARVYHLDRGYERIEEKLSGAGAKIWRQKA